MAKRKGYSPNQPPLFITATSDWVAPAIESLPPWGAFPRVGLDCETRDPDLKTLGTGGGRRRGSYLVGVSIAFPGGLSYYLPMRHEGGGNLDPDRVLAYLRGEAARYTGEIVGANLPYDLDFLASSGITFPRVSFFRDVQVADPLINELHMSYSLENIAGRWGLPGKDETLLRQAAADFNIDPKADLWRLPARFVGPYAEADAARPLEILAAQEREIEAQGIRGIFDLESRLLPVLLKARRRGVRVDFDRLGRIERWSIAKEAGYLQEIKSRTGIQLGLGDVWKPEAIKPIMTYLGVTLDKTATGKDRLDRDALEHVDHPAASAIVAARKVNKLRTTFAASVRDHAIGDRIHCTFNQLKKERDDGSGDAGAAFGRLSCEHPNLQQQPARDEFAPMWRAIYLPEEGQLWASNDYSQQEPRMAIHYACLSRSLIGEDAWRKAIDARDKYRTDPNTDNHQMMADMANIKRKAAKGIYLGLTYGMGGAKTCRQLGLPTEWQIRADSLLISKAGERLRWGSTVATPDGYLMTVGEVYGVDTPQGSYLETLGGLPFEGAGEEGRALLKTFDEKVPFLRKMSKACTDRAKKVGYITTLSGRRCRFPKDSRGNYDWLHKALNRLVQGSSADQTKTAMIELDRAGFDIIIQVHDEIALSVTGMEEARAAANVMETCVPLELPSKADVEVGKSWGHSMSPNLGGLDV